MAIQDVCHVWGKDGRGVEKKMILGHKIPVSLHFYFTGAMSYKIKLSLLTSKCMMTERLSEDVLKRASHYLIDGE